MILSSRKLFIVSLAVAATWLPVRAFDLSETEALRIRGARPGAVVQVPELLAARADLPELPVDINPDGGPQFLLSNTPECFSEGNGIALREEVQSGFVRLFLYHVPTPGEERRTISAVIENLGNTPLALRFEHRGRPSPGKNHPSIARNALAQFFNSKPDKSVRRIPAKGAAPLDTALDFQSADDGELVHAFYEFEINQPARVTVFQRGFEDSSLTVLTNLSKLALTFTNNGAGRGQFNTCDFLVTNAPGFLLDTANGSSQLILADGRRDAWLRGRDALTGQTTTNAGNFGTLYRIRLTRASSDGRSLAVMMCQPTPLAENCGGLTAVVKVSKGLMPGGVVTLPHDRVTFGGTNQAVILQRFGPMPKGETETIQIVYSPPGACCLPTPILFVPYE